MGGVDLESERLPFQRVDIFRERSTFPDAAVLKPSGPGSKEIADVRAAPAAFDEPLTFTDLPFALCAVCIEVIRHTLQVGGEITYVMNARDVYG